MEKEMKVVVIFTAADIETMLKAAVSSRLKAKTMQVIGAFKGDAVVTFDAIKIEAYLE